MKILAIETSCDDTGIAILEYDKTGQPAKLAKSQAKLGQPKLLADLISSQIKIHAPWGGVVPMLAKREHQRNLIPLFLKALKNSGLLLPEPFDSAQGKLASKAKKCLPFDSAPTRLAEALA
ncbi:hypothetical protein KJ590_01365, partial [Patescibacteria group bacterium]|nr:hypothetical protein [Patescibacteria group bacterium]